MQTDSNQAALLKDFDAELASNTKKMSEQYGYNFEAGQPLHSTD